MHSVLTRPATRLIALAAALTATLTLAPALSAQGLTYDVKMTNATGAPSSGAPATRTYMAGHGQVSAGAARIDFTESVAPGGMMGAGTYMITTAATGATIIVDPAKREYLELDLAALAKAAAGMQQALGGMVKMDVSDVKVGVEELGAGELIEGYATLKYRLTESHTAKTTVMGRTSQVSTHQTSELWIAPQLAGLMDPMANGNPAAARSAEGTASGGMTELQAQLTNAYAKMRRGAMLKSITTTESVDDGGHATTMTTTMTLSSLKRAAISPSVFEVPAGYTKAASPLDALGPLAAVGDSLAVARARAMKQSDARGGASTAGEAVDSAKAGAKQGVVEEAKDDAKAQAKKAIGRIFRRP